MFALNAPAFAHLSSWFVRLVDFNCNKICAFAVHKWFRLNNESLSFKEICAESLEVLPIQSFIGWKRHMILSCEAMSEHVTVRMHQIYRPVRLQDSLTNSRSMFKP